MSLEHSAWTHLDIDTADFFFPNADGCKLFVFVLRGFCLFVHLFLTDFECMCESVCVCLSVCLAVGRWGAFDMYGTRILSGTVFIGSTIFWDV